MRAIAGIGFFVGTVVLVRYIFTVFVVPIPTSIASMLIVFGFLLTMRGIPEPLDAGAASLFRVFPLLFIPPLVMVVDVMDVVISHVVVLLFAVTVSSVVGVLVTVKVAQWLIRRERSDHA